MINDNINIAGAYCLIVMIIIPKSTNNLTMKQFIMIS